jgi:alkylated DNA repair dioxygenase AlkB
MYETSPVGLVKTEKLLNGDACRSLLALVDAEVWSSELKRRVQHFGYRYDYRRRHPYSLDVAPFPTWAKNLVDEMVAAGVTTQFFDQLIVNEYLPGQGIAPHVDRDLFDNEIVIVSLGSPCVMGFTKLDDARRFSLLLEEGDLLLLRDEARYNWRHGIKPRKSDKWQNTVFPRARRVSLTFRKVLDGTS